MDAHPIVARLPVSWFSKAALLPRTTELEKVCVAYAGVWSG